MNLRKFLILARSLGEDFTYTELFNAVNIDDTTFDELFNKAITNSYIIASTVEINNDLWNTRTEYSITDKGIHVIKHLFWSEFDILSTRWIAIGSFLIAVIALVVSVIALFKP